MDTFIVTSNENQQNTNTNTNTSLHPLSEDYNDPIRRRKKAKGGEQKVRRRGMGVEKLERLRIQEKLKQQMSTEIIINNNNNNPFAPTFQFPMSGQNPGHFGQTGHNHNMGFHGVDQFHTNVFGVIKNAAALNCTTLSQNCNTCHKKKRVLGENNPGCGKVRKEVYNMQMSPFGENHFLTTKPAFLPQGHVEVVAVHRKGSSSERGSGVVMEYEFFPDGRSKNEKEESLNNEHDDLVMMKNLTTTTNTTSEETCVTGFDASTSIDLSLKLSL